MAKADWLEQLDWGRALKNVLTDSIGDWYRDPWGWPEYKFLIDNAIEIAQNRVRAKTVNRVAKIDVPKSNFATRPAVVLEPVDRLVIQAMADVLAPRLLGNLQPWVFGWRTERDSPSQGTFLHNDKEWEGYRDQLKTQVAWYDFGLKTDIVSCFASIPIERACEDIRRFGGRNKISERLAEMFNLFSKEPGRGGIPQRSLASCVVANMYLTRLDRVIVDYCNRFSVVSLGSLGSIDDRKRAVRWMDDYWIFSDDESELRSVQFDLQNEARSAGLELSAAKTELLSGDDLATQALRLEHSAVDEALQKTVVDLRPLEELLDTILADPSGADRSTIRFAMTRMRKAKIADRLTNLVDVGHRMPQGADHLARAFRDFGVWKDLIEWYIDYERSNWARIRWAPSQLGTMFPTRRTVDPRLIERFAEILAGKPDLPMMALTAQRLSSWRPELLRDCLRQLIEVANHPLERRLIGLAALAAGEERAFISGVLSGYEENMTTLRLIEHHDFRPFPAVADFSSG